MLERRTYERYELEVPVRVEIDVLGKEEVFEFQTNNISAAGAFLNAGDDFSEGTRCRLELTIPSARIKELTGAQSLIKVAGTVVRSTPEGVAICFDGDCQILGLKS